jgi:hypothetical protein
MIIGGTNRGRPNTRDLQQAGDFARRLTRSGMRYQD